MLVKKGEDVFFEFGNSSIKVPKGKDRRRKASRTT